MRCAALLALMCLLPAGVSAQVGSLRLGFSAPTASSLGKFGDVPVSLHTGIPDIAVPIFTAKGKMLELPITLRYHGGGIRVEETGGWVGMGWALQAGGSITRTVRGTPDDHRYGFYYTGHAVYDAWQNPSLNLMSSIRNKDVDSEPDQFFFNFGGRSGQFVMGPTNSSGSVKEVRTIPYQKMKIEPLVSGAYEVAQWTITTEDGVRYTFAAPDTSRDWTPPSPGAGDPDNWGESHVSTWHLAEIRAPGGDVIQLYYSPDTTRHKLNTYTEQFDQVQTPPGSSPCVPSLYEIKAEHEIFAQRLDSIKTARHTVVFIADTLRLDARSPANNPQEHRLDVIVVKTPAGTVMRRFRFEYDYFTGESGSQGRLRLRNVYEQDASGASLPPFSFRYDTTYAFPAPTSKAQDHWGYFNGKPNSMLIPTATTPSGAVLLGGDRSPDTAKVKVGSLTRITFPTGGYNEFVWQANDYGGIGPSAQQPYDNGPNQFEDVTSTGDQGYNQRTFTISGSAPVPVTFQITLLPNGCGPEGGCDICDDYQCPFAQVLNPQLTVIRTWDLSQTAALVLSPGTYTLKTFSENPTGHAYISALWQVPVAVNRKAGGGLRVAEIRTGDGFGNVQIRKYEYTLSSNPAKSSGLINAEPIYHYSFSAPPECSYFSRSSQSKTPLGSGASVTYREVTVLHGTAGQYGRSQETFRTIIHAPDSLPRPGAWTFSRTTSNEWKRGQPLEAAEYNSAGQPQRLMKSTHSFQDSEPITGRSFRGISVNFFSSGRYGTAFVYNPFEVSSGWAYQSADTTYTYDETGASSIVTAHTYAYENPNHIQLTRLTETNSDGTKRITRMKYPMDYADGSGNSEAIAITAMKTGSVHIHSPVIERWVSDSVGGTLRVAKAEITTYRTYAGRPLLWQHHILKSAGPVTNFVPSTVDASGSFTKDARYLYLDNAADYDAAGRLTFHTDRWGYATNYSYGGTPYSAFLGRIRRCAVASTCNIANPAGGLIQHALYDTLGNLTALRDSLSYRRFSYDSFGRLTQIKNHGNTVVQGYGYTYSRTGPYWTFDPTSPNAVVDTTYLQHTPAPLRVVRWTYLDGLGRPIQTVVEDGSTYIVTAQQYDALGREWRKWKPYPRTVPGYDPNFATNATTWYGNYHGVAATPYVETEYTSDALNRVKRVRHEFLATPGPDSVHYAYGVESNQSFTEVTDAVGMKTRSYRDGWGNELKTVLGVGAPLATTTLFSYNVLGQRTQLTDPRNLITTYTFNTQGHQSARTSPDAGTTSRLYDATDKLRYSQDANQAAVGQVYFTSYDYGYRPLTSGLGTATFAGLDPNAATPPALETNTANWLTVRAYDAKPLTTAFPWSLFSTQINGVTLSNVYGRLAAIANKSNGAWQVQLFSYDTDGRVAKRHTFTQANGGGSVLTALNDSVTYTHDLRDSVTVRRLAVGSNTWYQWFDYDNRGLLWKVFASTSSTKPGTADVTYTYRPSGSVWTRQFQGGVLDTLRYTIREQLERIGNVDAAVGPFAAKYFYNPDGTVKHAEFRSEGAPTAQKRYVYDHAYDNRKRLIHAQFYNVINGAWSSTESYLLGGMGYDLAGNLNSLVRYRADATPIDWLTYSTPSTSNRLNSLSEYLGASPETWDVESGAFTYDANGNMLTAPQPHSISAASYDHQNLSLSFTRSGVTSTYRYNEDGQRIAKQVGTGNTELYILDGRTTVAVYTVNGAGAAVSSYFNIIADGRVVGREALGVKRYYHTDMLGTTRAVMENGAIVEGYDYDPWGVLLEGRTLAGLTKEGFTGKERDAETGLDYFGFRYYMPAIGRWTTVDPLSDTYAAWSPYSYTLDSPATLVDPDGLEVRCVTKEQCQAAADSLNALYGGQTGITVEQTQWQQKRPRWQFWAKDQTVTGWRLSTAESTFDWSAEKDKYASGLYDVINSSDITFYLVLVPGGEELSGWPMRMTAWYQSGQLESWAGGGTARVSKDGNRTGDPLGVAIMHELVGHGHPVGGGDAHAVNRYYQAKLGYSLNEPYGVGHRGYHKRIRWRRTGLYR